MSVETAVILAAGIGSRLKGRTRNRPKGFLILNGMSLIERSCRQLAVAGIRRILIGTGYLDSAYREFAASFSQARVECVRSDRYTTTGSMYTLYNLRNMIAEPFLLLESDLLYESRALQLLLTAPAPDLILASGFTGSGDEVFIQMDSRSRLIALSKSKENLPRIDAELVGINKLSVHAYDLACAVMEDRLASYPGLDYEHGLVEVSRQYPIGVLKDEGLIWCEIDDEFHLARAEEQILPRLDPADIIDKPGTSEIANDNRK